MIAFLKGVILSKQPGSIILDVGGVGYDVRIPFSTYYTLGPEGAETSLHIYTHVREDVLCLYGFAGKAERQLFIKLLTIPGIGPSLALNILSGCSIRDLLMFITNANSVALTAIPGVGKKTAERIVLEMKGKLKDLDMTGEIKMPELSLHSGSAVSDAISALVNLGYRPADAEKAVTENSAELGCDAELDVLLRASLKKLSKL